MVTLSIIHPNHAFYSVHRPFIHFKMVLNISVLCALAYALLVFLPPNALHAFLHICITKSILPAFWTVQVPTISPAPHVPPAMHHARPASMPRPALLAQLDISTEDYASATVPSEHTKTIQITHAWSVMKNAPHVREVQFTVCPVFNLTCFSSRTVLQIAAQIYIIRRMNPAWLAFLRVCNVSLTKAVCHVQ